MTFTPKNLIKNINKIGPWSLYGLAEQAIEHYYPEYKRLSRNKPAEGPGIMAKLCDDWHGIVIRYQKEVGYKEFRKGYVNEF